MRTYSPIVAILVAIGALALSGCGGGEAADGATGKKDYTIAFVPGCTCDPYYSTQTAGFEDEAERQGVEAIVQGGANFDPADQIPVLQAVIRRKPDLIVVDPTDAKALIAPIRLATQQDIPVITTGNYIDADLAVTKIAASSIEGGKAAAETLKEMAKGRSGPVLINNVKPGISSTDDREQGFEKAMAGAPGLELLPAQYNNDDQAKASSITSATLRAHPDLVGVFATNVISAQGVAAALRRAGRKDVVAIGYDASVEQVRALEDGLLDAVISQDPRHIGELAVLNAIRYLDGDRSIPRDQPLEPLVITRENLDTPEAQAAIYR